jgi:hypothetical protein
LYKLTTRHSPLATVFRPEICGGIGGKMQNHTRRGQKENFCLPFAFCFSKFLALFVIWRYILVRREKFLLPESQ